jgi:hypothetical protein
MEAATLFPSALLHPGLDTVPPCTRYGVCYTPRIKSGVTKMHSPRKAAPDE